MMMTMTEVIPSRRFCCLNKEIKILNPAPRTCHYSSRNPPFSCTRSRISRVTTLWSRSTFPTTTSACKTTETCGSSPMLTLPPTSTTPVSRSINTTLRVSTSHYQLRFQSSTMIRLDLGLPGSQPTFYGQFTSPGPTRQNSFVASGRVV